MWEGAVGGGQEAGLLTGLDSACRRSMVRGRVVGAIRPGAESGRRLLAGKVDGAGFYGRNRVEEIAAVFEGRERRGGLVVREPEDGRHKAENRPGGT